MDKRVTGLWDTTDLIKMSKLNKLRSTDLDNLIEQADSILPDQGIYPTSYYFAKHLFDADLNLDQVADALKKREYDAYSAMRGITMVNNNISGHDKYFTDEFPFLVTCKALYKAGYKPKQIIRAVYQSEASFDVRFPEIKTQILDYLEIENKDEILKSLRTSSW